ncbi:hypothetical protein RA271_30235, partial [Pseudomonas syringae pv. tagetis]
SYFSDVAVEVICGLGAIGYRLALEAALEQLAVNAKPRVIRLRAGPRFELTD